MHGTTQTLVNELMDLAQIQPVIFDIGSSGYAQSNHSIIASRSTIVGFEADSRGQDSNFAKGFKDSRLISKAIVDDDNAQTVTFIQTKRPGCSSILEPDMESLKAFAFRDYFTTVKRVEVPALTLNKLVAAEGLRAIDWLKIDAQGADLRLVKSLNTKLLNDLLVVEVEPGLIDAYLGENLFPETHEFFRNRGFWLADLDIQKYPRISAEVKLKFEQRFGVEELGPYIGKSPTACEARYFRTVQYLQESGADKSKLVKAFLFGVSCGHMAYSLEILNLLEQSFATSPELLKMETLLKQMIVDRKTKPVVQAVPAVTWKRKIKNFIKQTPLARWN